MKRVMGLFKNLPLWGAIFGTFLTLGLGLSSIGQDRLTAQDNNKSTELRVGDIEIAIEPETRIQRDNGRWLLKEISKAKRGSTVVVPQGYYFLLDMPVRKSITLVGQGDVIFQASRPVRKGLIVPGIGVNLRIENVTFRGARSADRNGAGIRHEGRDLTIVDCIFEGNENGVLSTGAEKGNVEVHNSTFLNSGHGDGQSHGIYLSSGNSLLINHARFIGTKIGHHVKSLARITTVQNSYFDDAGAGTSYTVDVTRGGDAIVKDNFIIQRDSAQNATIINYDDDRGGKPGALTIEGNRIVNFHPFGRFYRNGTDIDPVTQNNTISNDGSGRLKLDG